MAMEGLMLKRIEKKPTKGPSIGRQKKRFNFKTTKKAINTSAVVADWLKDKTVAEVAEMWKIGRVQKKMTPENMRRFKEIKHCLKAKFAVQGV